MRAESHVIPKTRDICFKISEIIESHLCQPLNREFGDLMGKSCLFGSYLIQILGSSEWF